MDRESKRHVHVDSTYYCGARVYTGQDIDQQLKTHDELERTVSTLARDGIWHSSNCPGGAKGPIDLTPKTRRSKRRQIKSGRRQATDRHHLGPSTHNATASRSREHLLQRTASRHTDAPPDAEQRFARDQQAPARADHTLDPETVGTADVQPDMAQERDRARSCASRHAARRGKVACLAWPH